MLVRKKGKLFMKKKSRIPRFKSLEEEAHFWDTHSITDFEDETEDVEIVFDLYKPKEETLVLRLQKGVKEKLEKEAKKKGLNVSSLARLWLTQRLHSSS